MTTESFAEFLFRHAYKTGDFVLKSGARSTEYLDLRPLMHNPEHLDRIAREMLDQDLWVHAFAGVVLGGVPLAYEMARRLSSVQPDLIYALSVRPEAKDHGAGEQVVGLENLASTFAQNFAPWVVLVEDVITSGGSVIRAGKALQAAGCDLRGIVAVVDREQGGIEAIRKEFPQVPYACVQALATLSEIRAAAVPCGTGEPKIVT